MKLNLLSPTLVSLFALASLHRSNARTSAEPGSKPVGPYEMIVCPATVQNPRNSEADVELLKDGSLLMAYTEFYGGNVYGLGEGENCCESQQGLGPLLVRLLHSRGESGANECDVSESAEAEIRQAAMIYMLKNSEADCRVLYLTSSDEGKTWAPPRGA